MFNVMSQTGQLLHEDHHATLAAIDNLDGLLRKFPAHKTPDIQDPALRTALTEIKGVSAREVTRHFGFEENHLFPILSNMGQVGMVMLLKSEHEAILPVAQAIGQLAGSILESTTLAPATWQEFYRLGQELIERESFHIQKEEMGLLAAIHALVDPETDARLAETFRNLD